MCSEFGSRNIDILPLLTKQAQNKLAAAETNIDKSMFKITYQPGQNYQHVSQGEDT